jgi:hypothetical protein
LANRRDIMIVEEAWEKVAEVEIEIDSANLAEDNNQQMILQHFVELLVEHARLWHMEQTEDISEDAIETSWTNDEWQDMDSPSLGEAPEIPNMMGDRSERYEDRSPRSSLKTDNETEAEEMAEEGNIPIGRKRASRMRMMREKMNRYSDLRKEKRFQPVEGDIEVERVNIKRIAQTRRGEQYLKAGKLDTKLVQDKAVNQVVVGSDVKALYPSLEDTKVAEIIFQAIMETKIEFEGVNYHEGILC